MIGRRVHQYHFLEKLGSGGMGEVFKAQDTRLNRYVAVKVLTSSNSSDPERRSRFLQEAQTASALNHPNIIVIHDILSENDAEYLVMEYVHGKTLVDLIPKGGLRVQQVLKYSVQMADALQAAHTVGIIHRDLKPGNIMATESGLVKILDFGLAKLSGRGFGGDGIDTGDRPGAPLTVEGAILGTVSYMSPEQAQGKKVDTRSDIFSMGLVIYEMATGVRAFDGDSTISTLSAILRDEARPMVELAPDVPPQLEQVVSRCLRKNVNERWQSMQDLMRALAALKHETESGILHRSRLTSAAAPSAFAAASTVGTQGPASVSMPRHSGELPPQASVSWPPPAQPSVVVPAPGYTGYHQPAPAPISAGPMPPPVAPQASGKSPAGLIIGAVAAVAVLLVAVAGAWWWSQRAPAADEPSNQVAAVEPGPPAVEPTPAPVTPEPAPAATPAVAVDPGNQPAPPKAAPKQPIKGQPQPPVPVDAAPPAPTPAAEPAPAPVPAPVVTPAPAASPATQNVTVRDGTPLSVALAEDIPVIAEPGRPLQFVATTEIRVGDVLVVGKAALVTGQIVATANRRLIGGTKMTFKFTDVEAMGGSKIKVRAVGARRPDAKYDRQVETPVKPRSKDHEASNGASYVAYVDGDQTLTVRK